MAPDLDTPELAGRIRRVINSAFYGFPGEIRSIGRAAILMGLQSVKNVMIAASLTRTQVDSILPGRGVQAATQRDEKSVPGRAMASSSGIARPNR